jgi:hypothetical protein
MQDVRFGDDGVNLDNLGNLRRTTKDIPRTLTLLESSIGSRRMSVYACFYRLICLPVLFPTAWKAVNQKTFININLHEV